MIASLVDNNPQTFFKQKQRGPGLHLLGSDKHVQSINYTTENTQKRPMSLCFGCGCVARYCMAY